MTRSASPFAGNPGGAFAKAYDAVETRSDLTSTQKRVLMRVLHYAHESGQCWASQSVIAADLGLTRTVICRALGALVRGGFLHCKPHARSPHSYFPLDFPSDKGKRPASFPASPPGGDPAASASVPATSVPDATPDATHRTRPHADPHAATHARKTGRPPRPPAPAHGPPPPHRTPAAALPRPLPAAEPGLPLRSAPFTPRPVRVCTPGVQNRTVPYCTPHVRACTQIEDLDPGPNRSGFIKDDDCKLSDRKRGDAAPDPRAEVVVAILGVRERLAALGMGEPVRNPGGYRRVLMRRDLATLRRDLAGNQARLAAVEAERERAHAQARVGAADAEKPPHAQAWDALPEAERRDWLTAGRASVADDGMLELAIESYGADSPYVPALIEHRAQELHRRAYETAQERVSAAPEGEDPSGAKPPHERAWDALPEAERDAWRAAGRQGVAGDGLLELAIESYGADSPYVPALIEHRAQELHRRAYETAPEGETPSNAKPPRDRARKPPPEAGRPPT